jgi:hypothetical protein
MTAIRASKSEERLGALIVAKPGVSKWGLRERVREGVTLSRCGLGVCAPEKISNYRCTQVSFSAFSRQKSIHCRL